MKPHDFHNQSPAIIPPLGSTQQFYDKLHLELQSKPMERELFLWGKLGNYPTFLSFIY
jgi:hypothetical protein